MTIYTTWESPLCELLLVGERTASGVAVSAISMAGGRRTAVSPGWTPDAEAFGPVVEQLEGYFTGERRTFELDYAVPGTDFQQRVWRVLDEIPYGTIVTYRDIAEEIGAPRSVRAVGAANGANPLMIVRPCHRVIGRDGSLHGYAGGLERKRQLLDLESRGSTITSARGAGSGSDAG
ncbi:methylated-DNA--[protein]-cysteine S-methyltransferase [Nocardia sp. alder85J]|uniref:methylated-DNA--[protein]-cysteine S-methyltransferase n=1 Tax=Nocardia sp. alder85J TaxID=2862949 RepID=UPI001CD70DBD|nr:methylated-DNA--[protein]-cysteine S-methyltransferase [Nocardia sp. alder85J]MCX4095953.1 methylated-DNA--[protein]-cysteine S-methyltransferase [Nocardia sp. alder85J]